MHCVLEQFTRALEEVTLARQEPSAAGQDAWYEIWEQARDPGTSAEQLSELAQSQYEIIRSESARNPSNSPDTLRTLGKDASPTVRQAVAANRHTPSDVRTLLMFDSDNSVRHTAAVTDMSQMQRR